LFHVIGYNEVTKTINKIENRYFHKGSHVYVVVSPLSFRPRCLSVRFSMRVRTLIVVISHADYYNIILSASPVSTSKQFAILCRFAIRNVAIPITRFASKTNRLGGDISRSSRAPYRCVQRMRIDAKRIYCFCFFFLYKRGFVSNTRSRFKNDFPTVRGDATSATCAVRKRVRKNCRFFKNSLSEF